jgi:hypothetical protein
MISSMKIWNIPRLATEIEAIALKKLSDKHQKELEALADQMEDLKSRMLNYLHGDCNRI